ncbi:hypothetical protein B5S42_11815 [Gilliamella apicola]|uniref:hypothetical protein n=1 Tax=Gilliamella apicola TaxID=1196095 RepID=UPI000A354FF1|nr:hypothetical protein [Gilliamella apicola]OTP86955.1 hypothetical protein B5S42_11815 [Gilliamella apicola]OTQ10656.1 hypothetical protein B6C87_08460 [Gilliamella apicola]
MKKIILVGLIGVVLSGCGEKKVTKEMLVGDWKCTRTEQEADWKNGLFQDYSTPVNQGKWLIVYTKENDDLFLRLSISDRKRKLDFNALNEEFSHTSDDEKITSNNKLEYISDDEFKSTSEISMTFADSQYNRKIKTLMHCTRLK